MRQKYQPWLVVQAKLSSMLEIERVFDWTSTFTRCGVNPSGRTTCRLKSWK